MTESLHGRVMAGRRGVIVGVANQRSIAWGIARAASTAGAEVILTYQSQRLKKGVEALGAEIGATAVVQCDLMDEADLAALAQTAQAHFGRLDFVVHAAAFARKEDLTGRFIDTSRDGFDDSLRASTYSLIALTRALLSLLEAGEHPSVLALTYLGAQRAFPHYNVMGVAKAALESTVRYLAQDLGPQGIRVNALSAGPIRTLSASAVSGLRQMLDTVAHSAPLRRNVDIDEVGEAALFALSTLGRAMTAEVFYVDAGYHAVGAPGLPDA